MIITAAFRPLRARRAGILASILVVMLGTLLPVRGAPATVLSATATRVGASTTAEASLVGADEYISPGQGRDAAASQPQIASGCCVAAEDAGAAVDAANPSGFSSFRAAKAGMGSPGPGNVFDHVVEQSQIGRSGFDPEEIHNPFNMNPVSAETNQLKANYYSSKQFFTNGGTVRDWLTGQSFADQYEFGMDVLMRIEQGLPLP